MGSSWWNVGLDSVGETLYPQGTVPCVEWPCWGVLCTHLGHSYPDEGVLCGVPTWETVTLLRVSCVSTWETVTLLRGPVYLCGTQLPCWEVLCVHVGHSYPAESVLCIHVGDYLLRCSVCPHGTVILLRDSVCPHGRQLFCWGVLCAHMGDSYPAEGGLYMHMRHILIVELLLLQGGWIWVKNHFLKQLLQKKGIPTSVLTVILDPRADTDP